jgi:DNA-binding NarL/FixJ family response regulator
VHIRLCLVSTPGPICDATCATIAATPNVRIVALADGALMATHEISRVKHDVIILDANLPDGEVAALMSWIGENLETVRTVVVRTTTAECRQALAFGADAAMRRDELAIQLGLFIASLLQEDAGPQ